MLGKSSRDIQGDLRVSLAEMALQLGREAAELSTR
jgi:hypothetical protein